MVHALKLTGSSALVVEYVTIKKKTINFKCIGFLHITYVAAERIGLTPIRTEIRFSFDIGWTQRDYEIRKYTWHSAASTSKPKHDALSSTCEDKVHRDWTFLPFSCHCYFFPGFQFIRLLFFLPCFLHLTLLLYSLSVSSSFFFISPPQNHLWFHLIPAIIILRICSIAGFNYGVDHVILPISSLGSSQDASL